MFSPHLRCIRSETELIIASCPGKSSRFLQGTGHLPRAVLSWRIRTERNECFDNQRAFYLPWKHLPQPDGGVYLPRHGAAAGAGGAVYIASAATSREEIGNDVYPPARAELRAHGVPVGHRAAVQVTPRDYDAYDWLLTMDENNARNLRRILPHDPDGKIRPLLSFAGEQRGIADPWYTDDFGAAYADIVRGCTAFLEHLRRSGDL